MRLDAEPSSLKTGVYMIRNKVNGKMYVGSAAKDFSRRWTVHKNELKSGLHGNSRLKNAWDQYSAEAFEFTVLCRCLPEWCICMEQIYIQKYNSANRDVGYNIRINAHSNLGLKASDETKKKLSESLKRMWTPERREAQSKRLKGKKRPAEFCERMSILQKGSWTKERRDSARESIKPLLKKMAELGSTPEAKERHRLGNIEAAKKRTQKEWKKITDARWAGDAREKMSRVHKGKKREPHEIESMKAALRQPGMREKRSETMKRVATNNWKNPEYRAKVVLARHGK